MSKPTSKPRETVTRPLRILYVEDSPEDAELCLRDLEKAGFEPHADVVSTRDEFRRKLRSQPYDLILSDYNLRDWTGMDALQIAQKDAPDTPFILVTGTVGEDAAVECIKKGVTDFVLKDRPARLPSSIRRALEEKRLRGERKTSEEAVRLGKEEWERTFNTVPDPILVLDEQCQIIHANRAAAALAGLEPAQVIGKHCYEVVHGTSEPRADCPHQELICTGREARGDLYEPHLGKFYAATATPLRDNSGAPSGCVHVLHDVTEHRRAEEALRYSQELFQVFMDHSPAMAWMKDEEGRYAYCNKTMEQMLDKPQSEILGKTGFDLWPEEVAALQREHDSAVLSSGQAEEFSEPMLDLTRNREAWVLKFPFQDSKGRRLVGGIGVEVTERKRLEAQLRQAQKMEAVGQLAGGVAHDFNNLLTIISGYSDMIAAKVAQDNALSNQVKQIQKAAERAAKLTRQLLAFGRRQIMAPENLDLNAVVAHMGGMLPGLISLDIELKTAPSRELGRVKADAGQVEQIIINLAVNARDAMPQGGTLTLETSNVDITENVARQHLGMKPGAYVMLAVTDTGCGMDAETQAHIFEPFFTTKEEGKGTGLGLATVYGIVKQSGGYISVESAPGEGATFRVYLPRIEAPAVVRELAPAVSIDTRGTETILVVEDEEGLRTLVRGVLKSRGYRILEAASGEGALALCRHHAGHIDLLVTDVVMPKMNGPELASRLDTLRPEIKVLYISGYTNGMVSLRGGRDTKYAYLAKPFTPQALVSKVREVLDSPTALEAAA